MLRFINYKKKIIWIRWKGYCRTKMNLSTGKKIKNAGGMKSVVLNSLFPIKIIFSVSKFYGVSIIVEALRHNLVNFFEQTVLISVVLGSVEYQLGYSRILKCIIFFILVDLVAAAISSSFERYTKPKYLPKVQKKMKQILYQKAHDIDMACYDDYEYYNDFILALSESEKATERAEILLKKFFGGITIFICYGSFFVFKDIVSIIFVVVSFTMRIFFSNIANKIRYIIRIKENPLQRKRDYIRRVFYLNDYAKELRLYKRASIELHQQFDEVNDELIALYKDTGNKKFLTEFIAKHISCEFMMNSIYVLYLVVKASFFHLISCSDVVVLYNSASNLRRGLNDISDLGPYMIETSLYVEKIKQFLAYETKVINNKKHELPVRPCALEYRNVSFLYDERKKVLSNISFTIQPNERIALVGYNGAGKTTLIKLLMRLYDPTEGCILLDGIDIRDYDLEEYRNYIGIIFQDFKLFSTTIMENVVMDDESNVDEDGVHKALQKVGLDKKLLSLKNGIQTNVTKEFDSEGTDFSGGEAQKLAISRAFYKNAQMLIMDEPSSALDPVAEYQLNQEMYEAAKNRTVIFISHRLSTTAKANKIYMLENGTIIEQGTHEELLDLGKKYRQMWDVQAKSYCS